MPARISAADFRSYIQKNFALEGGKELKSYHLKTLAKAIGGHEKLRNSFHRPGFAAIQHGKDADPLSQQHATSFTKTLREAVEKGEILVGGKKLELSRGFRDVRGHGELQRSIRGITEEAARRAAPPAPTKEEIESKKVQATNRRAIADQIIQRNKLGTQVPQTQAMTSIFDATAKGAPNKAAPDTSSLHSIPKVVSIGDFQSRTQVSVAGNPDDALPLVGGAGQAAVGEQGQSTHEPTNPASLADASAADESSTVSSEMAGESDAVSPPSPVEETPPPAAPDDLEIG